MQDAFADANLLDPTALSTTEQDNIKGMAGFGALAIFLLPLFEAGFLTDVAFSLLVGGLGGTYLALRKDAVGAVARDVVGDTSLKTAAGAYDAAVKANEELELTEKAKDSAKKALDELQKKIKDRL